MPRTVGGGGTGHGSDGDDALSDFAADVSGSAGHGATGGEDLDVAHLRRGGIAGAPRGLVGSGGPPGTLSGNATAGDHVARDLGPGAVLSGRYEVKALLGRGGMGAVYRVRDRLRGVDVALKVMLPSVMQVPKAVERFRRETELMIGLRHEGVVGVHDAGHDEALGLRFYTMELLEGCSLRTWLEEHKRFGKRPEAAQALAIAARLLDALRYAHRTTVHRDLKPENVFLLGNDPAEAKILDFGIAKVQSDHDFTRTNVALGTLDYMAPEQRENAAGVDGRADLYAVSVILYEMWTGKKPLGRFKTPAEERPGLPPALDQAVMRGLEPDPEQRFESAERLLDEVVAIRRVLERGGGSVGGAGSRDRAGAGAAIPPRRSAAVVIGAAAFLVAVAGGGFGAWKAGVFDRSERSRASDDGAAVAAPYATEAGSDERAVGQPQQQPLTAADALAALVADLRPAPGAAIRETSIEVRGRLLDPKIATVSVNRVPVDREGDRFSVRVAAAPEVALVFRNAQGGDLGAGVVPLVIDRDAPVVVIDGGAVQYHAERDVTITGGVTDRTPDGRVIFEDVAHPLVDGRFAIPRTLTLGGVCAVRLEARDRAGNASSVDLRLVHDDADPKVHLDAPAALRTFSRTARVEVRGRVDDANPSHVEIAGERVALDPTGQFATTIDVGGSGDGEHDVEVAAVDRAGRRTVATRRVVLDTRAPAIQLPSPPAEVEPAEWTLEGDLDEDGCRVEVDGKAAAVTGRRFRATLALGADRSAVAITATDAAGNAATAMLDAPGSLAAKLPPGMRPGDDRGVYLHDTGKGVVIEMVYVPPGDFRMGTDGGGDEDPQHLHRVDQGYFIGRYETTWREYLAFCRATRRSEPNAPSWGKKDTHPVVNVSWDDAAAFCEWAGLQLPSEAQWEKAARGTDGRLYPWGNEDPTLERCVWDGHPTYGSKSTAPVGERPSGASPYGAHDMAGNVWEWCADWYDSSAYARYARGDRAPPSGGSSRVDRGGGWRNAAAYCRAANRPGRTPGVRSDVLGFRPVRLHASR